MAHRKNDSHVTVRVPKEVRRAFIAKAKKHGMPSEVLRDLIHAFTEDRVTVYPPVTSKEPIYVARKSA